MDIWKKIRFDFEQLGLPINPLCERYHVTKDELEMMIELQGWEKQLTQDQWDLISQNHPDSDSRAELLDLVIQEGVHYKAFALEDKIYTSLLQTLETIDSEFPVSTLTILDQVITQFVVLKKLKLKAHETFQKKLDSKGAYSNLINAENAIIQSNHLDLSDFSNKELGMLETLGLKLSKPLNESDGVSWPHKLPEKLKL